MNRRGARQLISRQREERRDKPTGKQHSEHAGRRRKAQALRDQHPRQTPHTRPERHVDGHFAPARQPRLEHQVRHVGGADDQEQKHRAQQHVERRSHAPDHHFGVRLHVDPVIVSELLGERLAERPHLAARSVERDSLLQPGEYREEVVAARRRVELHLQRHKQLGAAPGELRRHHPDHLVRLAVQQQLLSDGSRRAAEAPSPRNRGSTRRPSGRQAGLPRACTIVRAWERRPAPQRNEAVVARGANAHRVSRPGQHVRRPQSRRRPSRKRDCAPPSRDTSETKPGRSRRLAACRRSPPVRGGRGSPAGSAERR